MIDIRSLGIEPRHACPGTQRLRCPRCDKSGRDDALALTIDGDGSFVWCCHRCHWAGGSRNEGTPSWQKPAPAIVAAAQARQAPDLARRQRAALRAREIWVAAEPAPSSHAYLKRKRLESCGLRFASQFQSIADALLVPMRDRDGVIVNLQGINPRGDKRFVKDAQVKQAFALVSVPGSQWRKGVAPAQIAIGEGYATMVSFARLFGDHRAIAAMSAANVPTVAEIIRARFPAAQITVASDRDRIGLMCAAKAATLVGGRVWLPSFDHDDVNDFSDLEARVGE
jgi:putative DNA primase/helicase